VIRHGAFEVAPWTVREKTLDLDVLAQSESVFALSNGHIGLRANLDEGEPFGLPGTYLNGFYEGRPLPYAEAGFGADGRQRDQREADPAFGRGRAVRRPLRGASAP
jgi:alpha,alpha-trehalose phosphorylase